MLDKILFIKLSCIINIQYFKKLNFLKGFMTSDRIGMILSIT